MRRRSAGVGAAARAAWRRDRRRSLRRRGVAVAVAVAAVAAAVAGAAVGSGAHAGGAAGGASGARPGSAAREAIWRPAPSTTLHWQLSGRVDTTVRARLYDVDLFDTPRSVVAALHARGRRVACYLSAGTLERWRPDAARFPADVVGRPVAGWPGERWLDVRRLGALAPIMRARLDLCAAKGFDAVEADNVDGYANRTGFPVRAVHQLALNRFLAREAHARGLSIGLKNDLEQAAALEPAFDWALVEECFRYAECARLRPFVRAGKTVFAVEYGRPRAGFCARARRLGLTAMQKHRALGAWQRPCR